MPTLARRNAAACVLLVALALVAAACSSSGSNRPAKTVTVTTTTTDSSAPTDAGPSGSSSGSSGPSGSTSTAPSASPSSSPQPSASSSTKPAAATKPVHIKTLNADGATYGVGMPIIVFFQRRITSAKAFAAATKVTANGKAVDGAWYFETSDYMAGYPIEAHYRPANPWPAHSTIHVDLPVKGLSAGSGYAFDDSLTLDFSIGAAHIGVVNDRGPLHTITITNDGKPYGTFPVSLGANNTRTRSGIKVIMEQVPTVCMHDVNNTYHECGIKFDQRLTYDGEYLHAAPWNCTGDPGCTGPSNNINAGVDSSNGCTNLLPADAQKLYNFLRVGDIIKYPNANGARMQLGDGYGDWNVPWVVWKTGGIVPTT